MTSIILLCLLVSSSLVRANIIRSCNSGTGVATQTCNNTSFYCPFDKKCKPRSQRCTHPSVCTNTTTTIEDGCFETNVTRYYNILRGRSSLLKSFSRSKRWYELNHHFIVYRGFAYEFGSDSKVKILDTADPQYKYKNKKLRKNGVSNCTYEDATKFANGWTCNYWPIGKNCQDFANALVKNLTKGCL